LEAFLVQDMNQCENYLPSRARLESLF
jgi:hypothetical protein